MRNELGQMVKVPLEERFIQYVAEPYDVHNDCWIWTGATYLNARGVRYPVTWDNGIKRAHRASFELFVGPIPKGFEIHHMCGNSICVRPDHLEALSHKDHSRLNRFAQQTHCIHGHEFDEMNTYYPPKRPTQRLCRQCRRDAVKRYLAKRKER